MTDKPRRADTLPYWASAIHGTQQRSAEDSLAHDTRSTSEIIAAYLRSCANGDSEESLATVHYRGGPEEFQAGVAMLASADPSERAAGADVLAQLGWGDQTFLEESVDALLSALRDPEQRVVEAVIFALGHRRSPRAIEAILTFVDHSSADLRYATVHGLMAHDVPAVVDALIRLSGDAHRDVRDWATFILGSQFESDSPSLRAALYARVADEDPEVRGEALVGLARRADRGIVARVQRELEGEFHGDWAVEAAGMLADPVFLPALQNLRQRLEARDAAYFCASVQSAIAACEGRRADESSTLQ